jgi:hypothetical protein
LALQFTHRHAQDRNFRYFFTILSSKLYSPWASKGTQMGISRLDESSFLSEKGAVPQLRTPGVIQEDKLLEKHQKDQYQSHHM